MIWPGESYEGIVYATGKGGKGGIVTFREHADPDCEPPDEPEDEEYEDEEVEEDAREAA